MSIPTPPKLSNPTPKHSETSTIRQDKSSSQIPSLFGASSPYAEPLWYSRNTTPYYGKESHLMLRAAVRKYVDEEIEPFAFEWEETGRVPDEVFRRHAELGYLAPPTGLDVPLPGGVSLRDWDSWHTLILTDELSRIGYTGVIWGLGGGNSIGVPPIANFGTQEQKMRFLPDVASGKTRFCLGITEPDAGSDVSGIRTTATLSGTHYIVNGSKKWITNGIWADYCTAAVRTSNTLKGAAGISLLIIPLAAPGVTRRRMHNSGVNASGSTFLTFEDVAVPRKNLIGSENAGFGMIMSNFNGERKSLATSALRLSRVCIQDAWKHAVTRETFGKKLIENALIRSKFEKMGRSVEAAHAFLEHLTWIIEDARARGRESEVRIGGMTALLKVMATQALELCVREAQQVLGGLGYARGGKGGRVEGISRDVRVLAVGGGSEEIMSELAIREEVKDLATLCRMRGKL